MQNVYHITVEDVVNADLRAASLAADFQEKVAAAGGSLTISRAFGLGPAFIVVTLPVSVDPATIFTGDIASVAVKVAAIGEAETETPTPTVEEQTLAKAEEEGAL